jgi:hypothetical protein
MDPANLALAQPLSPGLPRTRAARADRKSVPLSTLHHRSQGRRSKREAAQGRQYLTPDEETAVAKFLLMKSELGHPVRIKFLPSIAFSVARQRSSVKKPNKPPGQKWARCFAKRHPEIKARTVKPVDWNRHEKNTYGKMVHWFEVIEKVLQDPAVVPENVYNMDETGVMLSMLSCVKVLVGRDDVRDYRGAGVKRTMVTAIECISGDGRVLLPLIIWPASTHRSNWTTYPNPGWHYAHSENGYNNSKISLEWLTRVFDPQTKERANGKSRVIICDGFGSHETLEVLEFCLANNIVLCRLPSHTSHKLQPCDVAVFAALKAAYRDEVDRLGRGGVDTIGKEHFTSLYSPARVRAFTKRNITSAWATTGLFPFNPNRVLKNIPKPVVQLAIPEVAKEAEASAQIVVAQTAATPVTPVNTEDVHSLFDRIKQDAEALDEPSKQELLRHAQMMAKATRVAFAERSLLQDHNRFLSKINGEIKARRSTKSLVLGTAMVMTYEQLEKARAKRAADAEAAADKARRRRKGKSSASKKDAPEGMAQTTQTGSGSEPYKAPVARMVAADWPPFA